MNEVKRYSHKMHGSTVWLDEVSDGKFVSYSDYAALQQKLDAMSHECGMMLGLLNDISHYHEECVHDDMMHALIPLEYVSAINTFVSRDVDGESPCPLTDAFLNALRAEGVEMFAKHCDDSIGFVEPEDEEIYTLMEEAATAFAVKLRAGDADKAGE